MKDYKVILEKYQFTDAHGYALEYCQDYLDLLADLHEAQIVPRCARCGQINFGQSGEYACLDCGLPTLHDQ